jgi:TrmH family RNA methyltransferase
MPLRIVQSKQNARLKELRQAFAHPGRNKNLRAGIEGPNLLAEAIRAGLAIDCVFAAQETEDLLIGLGLPAETEILLLPRSLLAASLETETPQPLAALIDTPQWTWEHILAGRTPPLILVLAGLQDPGNLGTILRSAEAFGASGVICLAGTVSPWNPKAVRASAGSIFRVPVIFAGADESLRRLHDRGVTVWTTAARSANEAARVDLAGPVALIIGNEGNGVPPEIGAMADGELTIPCPGPVESLNAAVAAGILLYEASRQRAVHLEQRASRSAQ